ncbi:MAG: L,D-transpeptidase [Hyphomicrobium sp.]
MRGWGALIFAVFAVVAVVPGTARADVAVEIDVGGQSMDVFVNGVHRYSWPVSTGRSGYATPTGSFRAKRMEREWYSSKYDDAPMPYSIFFTGGYAIHGTSHTRWLGQRASHGCVRLAPGNAARLFSLVAGHGLSRTRISVYN